jgi:hypothetical protein
MIQRRSLRYRHDNHVVDIDMFRPADNPPDGFSDIGSFKWLVSLININCCSFIPVEAGLVFRSEDYVYSSASDYAGYKGMLDIFVI